MTSINTLKCKNGLLLAVVTLAVLVPLSALAEQTLAQLKPKTDGSVGYKKKRFIGGPLTVIPEAVMDTGRRDAEGQFVPDDPDERIFVILGPDGYTWRFTYDVSLGIPEYTHVKGERIADEYVEVTAPETMAFRPITEIYPNAGLNCRNVGTCSICNCCIMCICSAGNWCDEDDTGFYGGFPLVEERYEIHLR